MPIPLPILDDRRFDDLVEELRALIPRYCPEWTDHNPSDPGITLIELFAWLGENQIYRLNRLPDASRRQLLSLLQPGTEPGTQATLALEDLRASVLRELETPWRAVTADDFETLVLGNFSSSVARVRCLADTDLDAALGKQARPGHVSLVVVPCSNSLTPTELSTLLNGIFAWLDERRLITCRLHVAPPGWVEVALSTRVVCTVGAATEVVAAAVRQRLQDFFASVGSSVEQAGWPFGKDVYVSEVYAEIETAAGVDHVENLCLYAVVNGVLGERESILSVPPNSLVRFAVAQSEIDVISGQ
jgi:hypothetical protein